MRMTKTIEVGGGNVAGGKEPLICTPLVAIDERSLLRELAAVCAKQPDLIEWRVDFFSGIADTVRVVALARALRENAGGVPIIFTRRSTREGGEPTGISEEQVLALYEAVCETSCVDFVDCEMSSDALHFQAVRQAAQRAGIQLIASFHDFQQTPSAADIVARFVAMERAGADIAKVAAMPRAIDDVLTLLAATLEGNRQIRLPIISMSMGPYGSLSRLFGWAFGSSVTFAVGEQASAPGQVPIEDLRAVLEILQRALAPR
ncbi:type I 3-dehydroquinate dehydratase [Candidatus Accumulibacter aalborgensis]|nr:type I 3-dehydroquinate dehydratase [Candidatus Accumulibacter aalborgensis]